MSEPAYDAHSTTGDAAAADNDGAPAAHPGRALTIDSCPDGDRVAVVVRGELDLDVGQPFQYALREALSRSAGGIDLDLGAVEFCDCSALNILISLRHRALAEGKTVVLRATSPVIERLLALTDTHALFTGAAQEGRQPVPRPRH
ncbi:STAS domain-containing protein [Streptomyces sp. NPDC046197]|uniref:STAS domain-containing protein n=1 Tax=Streptomyces sp. NPDC046197 TaxID=3154337 RepID=UPI003405B334